ncbi:hypothetical protein NDU88_009018 [Pleurodeles waltl]|uniref:Uncharacterized protein n=1 Tax=Pleurodeles waltl TaxID=8319 RepID=A0AAV7RVF2_PLEWA|nr:hypothetical protein NDU88_009018 [Pleurodeles waltl]
MKTTLTPDSTPEQRSSAFSSQKNPRRKENGSSAENTGGRNVKLQTSFPPIHFSLSTPARSVDRNHKEQTSTSNISRDARGQKFNLPQVEKAVEKIPRATKHVVAADKSKLTLDIGRNSRPHSSTPLMPLDVAKDAKLEPQPWLDVPSPKVQSERLSPESPSVPECPSCKKERRIRNDYDKIIVQSRQDKEILQQKIADLEAEMAKYKEEASNKWQEIRGSENNGTCNAEQQTEEPLHFHGLVKAETCESKLNYAADDKELTKLEEENKRKQEQIDSLLNEIEELRAQLDKIQENEKVEAQKMKNKHCKLVHDMEELKSQLEKSQDKEKQHLSEMEQEKESILLQLETTKSELERLKKRRALPLSELRKEKDACLAEIEDLKAYTEKMRAENNLLLDRIHTFEQDLAKGTLCPCLPSHTYAVPPNTEMLVISHQVSQQSTYSFGTGLRNCCCGCHGGTVQDLSSPKCAATRSPLEEEIIRFKDVYRQLKRERNLLLDVMEIMYTRRWFLEEAVPHVKRALKKCGVIYEDGD